MNLKLAGTFQGIEILASITDNNIPIQPQGNTQTLQDFDKVFIQFSKDGHRLIAGDFQTKESNDIFLKYNKKAQGLSYTGKYASKLFKQPAALNIKSDVALSRGKFNRQSILGVEGNQGPYQLFGAENERFIIVLSGTEIKSIRQGRASIVDSFCSFNDKKELFVINMHVEQYSQGGYVKHKIKGDRKLLLEKKELLKKILIETL